MTDAGQVAKNEAAKQAVILVFAVAGMLLLIPIQKRLLEHAAKVMQESDSATAALERMKRADQAAKRWDRIASYLFDVRIFEGARRAWGQARKARAEYEQARNA